MGSITSRTSLFNLGVQFSLHPAFDVLSYRDCPCANSRGNSRVLPLDFASSSSRGFHLYDGDEPVHQKGVSTHMLHMYGFAFLGFLRFRHHRVCYCVRSNRLSLRRRVIFLL